MNRFLILCAALLLGGCAQGTLTTRGAITLAGDKVLLCSQWGALPCIGTEIDGRDAWAIIEAMKARAALEALVGGRPEPARPRKPSKSI
jgi:hypothetical protein